MSGPSRAYDFHLTRGGQLKRLISTFVVFAALALALPAPAGDHTFKPPDAKALAIQIISEPESYDLPFALPDTVMKAQARCSTVVPRGIDVMLHWDVKQADAKAYRVDITELRDGFAKGRFLTSGERPPAERLLPFEDAQPGLYYYWRVLTSSDAGWVVSGAGRFDSPVCASDVEDSE